MWVFPSTVDPFYIKQNLNFPESFNGGGVSMLPPETQGRACLISMSSGTPLNDFSSGQESAKPWSWCFICFLCSCSSTVEVTVVEFLEEHVSPPDLRTYRLTLHWGLINGLRSRRKYPSPFHSFSMLVGLSMAIIRTWGATHLSQH